MNNDANAVAHLSIRRM